ncbi:MAG TPA: hypothetical protein VHS96_01730, partial [Bacteroidia bacterium]|nr:hypothetical protein [Bacteroidia bacterium]
IIRQAFLIGVQHLRRLASKPQPLAAAFRFGTCPKLKTGGFAFSWQGSGFHGNACLIAHPFISTFKLTPIRLDKNGIDNQCIAHPYGRRLLPFVKNI